MGSFRQNDAQEIFILIAHGYHTGVAHTHQYYLATSIAGLNFKQSQRSVKNWKKMASLAASQVLAHLLFVLRLGKVSSG
jgi:hypothetical protein